MTRVATLLLAATFATVLAASASAQPRFAPSDEGTRQPPAAPPPPGARPDPAAQRRAELDRLLEEIARAPDEDAARPLEARVRTLWVGQATPAVSLLLRRASRNLGTNDAAQAVEDLDAALTLQPEVAEAWLLRAEAQARTGDAAAAAADLREALRLEPRHFGALFSLSQLQEERGDLVGALKTMEAALRLHPHMPGGRQRLRDLTRRAEGDGT